MRTRGRGITHAALALLAGTISLSAAMPAQSAPPPQSTFRTGVEGLSLSALILAVTPSDDLVGEPDFTDLLPVISPTPRTFRTRDRVTAFLRVYQGASTA